MMIGPHLIENRPRATNSAAGQIFTTDGEPRCKSPTRTNTTTSPLAFANNPSPASGDVDEHCYSQIT